mmetsp:Transcript_21789/g.58700  ORF Transcript_21789/g.58700 Transcript_21789/m.58700 type:complete len:329 (-) Transcript_21789:918-1904(-)
MNAAAIMALLGTRSRSERSDLSWESQRPRSPPSFSMSFCAAASVDSAFSRLTLSVSASAVFFWKSDLSTDTFLSSCASCCWHSATRCLDATRRCSSCVFCSSRGATFCSTLENSMLATTHAASGAAATLARRMLASSNELAFWRRSCMTESRVSAVMLWLSKLRISSLTDLLPRKRFMEIQDVSKLPMMRSTPSSTSRMASGGVRRALISLRLSERMPPTACLAASRRGRACASSFSMAALCLVISCSSTWSVPWSSSTSFLRSSASSMAFWISTMAVSASFCASASLCRCSLACLESTSTALAASLSLPRPPLRCSMRRSSSVFLAA